MVLSVPKPKLSAKGSAKKIVSPALLKHAIQFEKLQQKSALQTAAIDSIRHVLRQKATLEKECAQAIEKLLTQHSSRKDLQLYFDILHEPANGLTDGNRISNSTSDSEYSLTLAELWKIALADMQRQQILKITACEEVIRLTAAEDLKASKLTRSMQVKRGVDVILEVQREVDAVADRVTQSKKSYWDSETIVQETQTKIRKLEEKSKKASKAAKIPEKFPTLLSIEVPKATAARNEYLLSVAGANAFLAQYYSYDLPYVIDIMNGDIYDSVTSTLTSVFETEHRLVPQTNELYETLLDKVKKMNKAKDVQSFTASQPCLKEPVLYSFEPVLGDTMSTVTSAADELTMDKCARKWTMRYVEGQSAQNKLLQQWDEMVSQKSAVTLETTEGKAAMDAKMFTLQESLRRAATYQLQAKNILDVLKQGSVDVEKWMENARQAMEHKPPSSDGPEIISTLPSHMRRRHEQSLSAVVDSETADNLSASGSSVTGGASIGPVVEAGHCIALYDYSTDRPDELSFVANQELRVLSGATDEQWLLVEDANGQQGYIPSNYVTQLDKTDDVPTPLNEYSTGWNDAPTGGWDDPVQTWGDLQGYTYEPEVRPAAHSTTSSNADLYGGTSSAPGHCRALFDYTADDPEDLSFREGDVIRVISRISSTGVDDGFWRGELNGRTGLFMVALTEELVDFDKTSDMGTSVSSNSSPLPTHLNSLPPAPSVPPRAKR